MGVPSKLFLAAWALAVVCGAVTAHAEVREGGADSCSAEGVAACRKREAAEESDGTMTNPSGAMTELGAITGATILGIAAVASLFAGIAMVPSGVERMRLLEPLLTSDPSTWKTRESAEISLSPRFGPESGGLALSISF